MQPDTNVNPQVQSETAGSGNVMKRAQHWSKRGERPGRWREETIQWLGYRPHDRLIVVRLPPGARCCVCSSERPHQLWGPLDLLATGTEDLSRRYNALPLTSTQSGPIPLLHPSPYVQMARKGETAFFGASARRAHKVAIRPVIQLPDVAHPDESPTVML